MYHDDITTRLTYKCCDSSYRKPKCTVLLKVRQPTHPCCILRTLCRGGNGSLQAHGVNRVNRVGRTPRNDQRKCNNFLQYPSTCIYSGSTNSSCSQEDVMPYVPPKTNCEKRPGGCNCSAYCNATDAYYYIHISIQDSGITFSNISSLMSNSSSCIPATGVACPSNTTASKYQGAHIDCGGTTNLQSCDVVLGFAEEVPVCDVSAFAIALLSSANYIDYNGQVTRAAFCLQPRAAGNPLYSTFIVQSLNIPPIDFCLLPQQSLPDILTCRRGQSVCVLLSEQCNPPLVPTPSSNTTTPVPITTAGLQNTTTANATSSPLNTTSPAPVNATSSPVNTTSPAPVNATSPPINTTSPTPVNTTSPPINTTSPALVNTTSVPINTTSPAPVNATSPPINATSPAPVNETSSNLNTTSPAPVKTTSSPLNETSPAPVTTTATTLNTTKPAPPSITTAGKTTVTTVTMVTTTTTTTGDPVTNAPVTTITESPTTANTTSSNEQKADKLLESTRDVSKLNSSQVDQLVNQLEDLLSGPNVSRALGNTSIHIVSNLLGAPAETVAASSKRLIGIVDTVGLKLVLQGETETILSRALALSVKKVMGDFEETTFSISDPDTVQVHGPRVSRSVDASVPQASVRLPTSLIDHLSPEDQEKASRVQFNFYQKGTLFQDRSLGDQRRVISGIVGASVANLTITGLKEDVSIHLRITEPIPANFVATCVFWDFSKNDGAGGWNPYGCSVRNVSADNVTTCGCDHLTSFAILLDLAREAIISRTNAIILTYITYIGCGISAIFLSVTLLTYAAFGKLHKDIRSKILMQQCLSLLLLNLTFLVDSWLALYPDAVGLCISTAWFLHYFLLVSFTWMGLQGVHMYLTLVKVFNTYITNHMLKLTLAGWGVPMVVVIIVIAVDKDNYGAVSYAKYNDGTSDDFCWIKNDVAFYVAVVAYFCIIFLFNCVMFVMVMVQLCRIKKQNPHNQQHRNMLQDIRSVMGITMLLGLTWGFAFFAWGPVSLAFMYLFAIFNSLQGFFIFVFHCAVKENVRRQWRTYLCCGNLRLMENSDWSRTATQKTWSHTVSKTRNSSATRSNNSSSPSPLLVGDPSSSLSSSSSEAFNGIGNPIDDTLITADEELRSDVVLNEINSQYRNQQTS